MVCLHHKAERLLVCGLWTHLKGCQLSLLQWVLDKTLCWHLPFRVLNARKIIWLQHKKFRATSFRMFPSPSDARKETFMAAGFQRAGSTDGTSPEGVLQRNHVTWLASWHPLFLLFSISFSGELCNLLCSVLIYSVALAPRGNITISFNSLCVIWYCSVCLEVICVMLPKSTSFLGELEAVVIL